MLRSLIALALAGLCAGQALAAELVIYTERKEPLVKPFFERYERETGVKVRWLSDGAPALIERLAAEGSNTRADIFMAVDAGSLWQAAERDLLLPIRSPLLEEKMPVRLRDPEGRWFAQSQRARTIV
ncbi:MAG TPA: extracellular solute-binding protein [Arenimonas sp.]|nr:extracellular solute-binding protein [Arenimonas sp.]